MRWFERHLPPTGVTLRPCAMDLVGLSIAGPKSRELLQRLDAEDVSPRRSRSSISRRMDIGMVPAFVGRVTYTGDLGYEIWVKPEYQRRLYELLMEAGADLGIRPFRHGAR